MHNYLNTVSISGKTIDTNRIKNLLIEGEHNADIIYFKLMRYHQDIDLLSLNFTLNANINNTYSSSAGLDKLHTNGDPYFYLVFNVTSDFTQHSGSLLIEILGISEENNIIIKFASAEMEVKPSLEDLPLSESSVSNQIATTYYNMLGHITNSNLHTSSEEKETFAKSNLSNVSIPNQSGKFLKVTSSGDISYDNIELDDLSCQAFDDGDIGKVLKVGSNQNLALDFLGSAAYLDAPSSGNAFQNQLVLGSDSRLSNPRTPAPHTHPVSEITGLSFEGGTPTSHTHTVSDIVDFPDSTDLSEHSHSADDMLNQATAFNKNFESSPDNFMPNSQTPSVGLLNTLARADHVHPSDPSKADKTLATQSLNGLMSMQDKTKLDNISEASFLQADWNEADQNSPSFINNKPSAATSTSSGLMSSLDKIKLDSLSSSSSNISFPNPNLLINGNFCVWQRGSLFQSPDNNSYTADRWKVSHSVDNSFSISKATSASALSCLRLAISSQTTQNSTTVISQKIDDVATLRSKPITFSFNLEQVDVNQLSGYCYIVAGTQSQSIPLTEGLNSVTHTVWEQADSVEVFIVVNRYNLPANSCIDISNAKLELSSLPTSFFPNTYSQELLACKRYFQKISNFQIPLLSLEDNNSLNFLSIFFETDMHSTPTVSIPSELYSTPTSQDFFGVFSYSLDGSTACSQLSSFNFAAKNITPKHIDLSASTSNTAQLQSGLSYYLSKQTSAHPPITLDAELY